MKEGQKGQSGESLETVRAAFEEHRQRRLGRRALPDDLWKRAVGLLESYPITRVCRQLRLNSQRLAEQRARLQGQPGALGEARRGGQSKPSFIEISAGQMMEAKRRANGGASFVGDRGRGDSSNRGVERKTIAPISARKGVASDLAPNGVIERGCSVTIERPDGWCLSLSVSGENHAAAEALCARFFGISGTGEAFEVGPEMER